MLAILSPSKTLDFESATPPHRSTQPAFLEEAEELVVTLRKKSRPRLAELMSISDKLADLNFRRYRDWSRPFDEDNARSALFAFTGDVYAGFSLDDYDRADIARAQKHLRILSGLYGLLRPLDLIQPYRLEMGTSLKNPRGNDLYAFWGNRITTALNDALKKSGGGPLVNLASNEYFRVIDEDEIRGEIITPQFKDWKNGTYKFISFHAKKARGLMADFLVREKIDDVEDLRKFDVAGYSFHPDLSEGNNWVFTREEATSAAP